MNERLSRTQKKKNALALQKLGEKLVELDDMRLDSIGLSEELRDAIRAAKGISRHEARRRQLQYIGRLMRDAGDDTAQIQEAIARAEGRTAEDKHKFKQVELWRDELLNGSQTRLEWLMKNFPQVDLHRLRELVNQASGGEARSHTKRASRNLFRYLRQLID